MPKDKGQQYWSDHIKAQEASGHTQKVYCKKHGLNIHSLGYWRKRIKDSRKPIAKKKPKFTAVALTKLDHLASAQYDIVLSPSESVIKLSGDFDLNKFKSILEILETRSC